MQTFVHCLETFYSKYIRKKPSFLEQIMIPQYGYPSKNILSLEQPSYVLMGDFFCFMLIFWPGIGPPLQPFLKKSKPILVPIEDLQKLTV